MGATDSEALDHVFRALADATRRTIFEILGQRPGSTTSELARSVPRLSRWAVMKHLQVLREAGLVQTLPRGRQRCHFRIERTLDDARQWLAREGRGASHDGPA